MSERPLDTTYQPALPEPSAPAEPLRNRAAFLLFCSLILCWTSLLSGQAPPRPQSLNPADLHFREGMQLLKQQNWRAAADEFRAAIKNDPQRAEAHNQLGLALERLGERENAWAEFRRAIELDPSNAEAHYNLGMAEGEEGDSGPARDEFVKAVVLKPDLSPHACRWAFCGSKRGSWTRPPSNTRPS